MGLEGALQNIHRNILLERMLVALLSAKCGTALFCPTVIEISFIEI
jgi:hypothetical protein